MKNAAYSEYYLSLLLRFLAIMPIMNTSKFITVFTIMKAKISRGIAAYRNVNTTATAPYADSIQLTQMLFSALVESLAEAEGHMRRNAFEKKAGSLNRASKILLGLQDSLDFEKGQELAINLSEIYDYARRRLFQASLKNDLAAVQEVRGLIAEIDSAWQLLPSVLSAPSSAIAS